jgi:hypothetical protein
MPSVLLPFFFGLLLATTHAYGQGGIRLIIWNLEPVEVDGLDSHYGLGYDHDLNKQLSMGINLRYSLNTESVILDYRSAFHFSDNDRASFYMGPTVGMRFFRESGYGVQVPLGFRMGVRGGLENFYADLYLGAHYNLGASGAVFSDDGFNSLDLRKGSFGGGLDLGFGWDSKR